MIHRNFFRNLRSQHLLLICIGWITTPFDSQHMVRWLDHVVGEFHTSKSCHHRQSKQLEQYPPLLHLATTFCICMRNVLACHRCFLVWAVLWPMGKWHNSLRVKIHFHWCFLFFASLPPRSSRKIHWGMEWINLVISIMFLVV